MKKIDERLEIRMSKNLKETLNAEANKHNISITELCRQKLEIPLANDNITNKALSETLSTLIKQNRNLNIMCYRLLVAFILINHSDNSKMSKVNFDEEKLKKMAERTNYNVTDIVEWYAENPDKEDWL